jgi:hypothetical protein
VRQEDENTQGFTLTHNIGRIKDFGITNSGLVIITDKGEACMLLPESAVNYAMSLMSENDRATNDQ